MAKNDLFLLVKLTLFQGIYWRISARTIGSYSELFSSHEHARGTNVSAFSPWFESRCIWCWQWGKKNETDRTLCKFMRQEFSTSSYVLCVFPNLSLVRYHVIATCLMCLLTKAFFHPHAFRSPLHCWCHYCFGC